MTIFLLNAAVAAEAPAIQTDSADWDVNLPFGPTHPVSLDLREGTWMSVTVHADTVVFDLLGDLWSVPISGGEATRLTSGAAWDVEPQFSPDGKSIAFTSDRSGNENIWVVDADGKNPRQITKEEEARATDAVWDPSGPYLLYRRRTVDTRSIGVTELWQHHLSGGDGFALTKLDAQPHAAEATIDGRYVYFSSRHSRYEYEGDAVAGLWDVLRLDRRTGDIRPILNGPGSASRPTLSRDRKTLYFVSRDRNQTLLEALDLATGARRTVTDTLSPDELEAFSLHGTYPRFSTASDGDVVIWAGGKLWRIDPATGARAEIPFHAKGDWTMHDTTRWPIGKDYAAAPEVQANVLRWPTVSKAGTWAFSALGVLWTRTADGQFHRISPGTGYAPAWSPDGKRLAWTSWSDTEGGRLHVTNQFGSAGFATRKPSGKGEVLPVRGQLTNPAWSEDGQELVVLRGVPGEVPGTDLSNEPWFDVVHLKKQGGKWVAKTVLAIDGQDGSRRTKLALHGGRVWWFEYRYDEPRKPHTAVLKSVNLDGADPIDHVRFGAAEEVSISPDFARVAYKLDHQLFVTALPPFARGVEVASLPTTQVTKIVGDWLDFTPDSAAVTWAEGPTLRTIPVSALWKATDEDEEDEDGEGKDEEKEKKDPFALDPAVASIAVQLRVPRAVPSGTIVLTHARVLPMTGDTVLEDVNVVIERNRIVEIGPNATRPGAQIIDCAGKTIMPGLVDVHAHLHFTAADILPEQEWRYLTALDFGVTTVHDPSAFTDLVFTQQERVEAGYEDGPRVFSTGAVLYGALASDGAKTPDLDAARGHVRRLKEVGATTVKVYQQSQRERRQWYSVACNEEHILCVPEGGGDLWHDLSMIVDGYPSIEHAFPTTPLYADVIGLVAGSTQGGDGLGAFHTPTLQVAYGGMPGKHWYYQHLDPFRDERLRRHTPGRWLDAELWRYGHLLHDEDWRFQSTARDEGALVRAGAHVTLGAHGELQGLGVHYELWGLGGVYGDKQDPGALSTWQALRAGTIEGARYIGMADAIGTVEVGKLADLIVLDANPLDDLMNTTKIAFVLANGEVHR